MSVLVVECLGTAYSRLVDCVVHEILCCAVGVFELVLLVNDSGLG